MNSRKTIAFASFSGALAVILGAFGAHALKGLLSESAMGWYQTANHYHFIHTLAILASGLVLRRHSDIKNKALPAVFFFIGILLFCGSLYTMAFLSIKGQNISFLGPITPLGGIFFILGWLYLGLLTLKIKQNSI